MRFYALLIAWCLAMLIWRTSVPITAETMYKISEACTYGDVVSATRQPMLNGSFSWNIMCSNGTNKEFIGDS